MRSKRRGNVLAIGAAALAVAVGGAYAASAIIGVTTSNPLAVCVNDTNGQMRAVASAGACRTNESAIELQKATGPQSVTVDCAAGETVGQALADTAEAPSVEIAIEGTCTESVTIDRDEVTLRGAAPGDGLEAPSPGARLVLVDGARGVVLAGLTLSGGGTAVGAFGSELTVEGARIVGSGTGVQAGTNAAVGVVGTTIDGAMTAVQAFLGASVVVSGGTIENSRSHGINAGNSASVVLSGGVIVRNGSFHGALAGPGGSVTLVNGTIETSANTGMYAFAGGSVFVQAGGVVKDNRFGGVTAHGGDALVVGRVTGNGGCGVSAGTGGRLVINDGATISGNRVHGICVGANGSLSLERSTVSANDRDGVNINSTAVATIDREARITGNGGWGVLCMTADSRLLTPASAIDASGNTAGQVDCPNS